MCPSLSNLKKWKRKERRCCLKVELTITQFLHLTFLSFLLSQSSVWCVWTLLDLQPAALLVFTWFRSSPTSSFSLSLFIKHPHPPFIIDKSKHHLTISFLSQKLLFPIPLCPLQVQLELFFFLFLFIFYYRLPQQISYSYQSYSQSRFTNILCPPKKKKKTHKNKTLPPKTWKVNM